MIAGIADDEVKREVLWWHELDDRSTEERVTFSESKEMIRDTLNKHSTSTTPTISSYKRNQPANESQSVPKAKCRKSQTEMDKISWSRREKKMVEQSLCLPCWMKINKPKHKQGKRKTQYSNNSIGKTGAITIGSITNFKPILMHHFLFDTKLGWCKAKAMSHPTLKLRQWLCHLRTIPGLTESHHWSKHLK